MNSFKYKKVSERALKRYFKVIMVRHPLDRLASCYLDRVVRLNTVSVMTGIKVSYVDGQGVNPRISYYVESIMPTFTLRSGKMTMLTMLI